MHDAPRLLFRELGRRLILAKTATQFPAKLPFAPQNAREFGMQSRLALPDPSLPQEIRADRTIYACILLGHLACGAAHRFKLPKVSAQTRLFRKQPLHSGRVRAVKRLCQGDHVGLASGGHPKLLALRRMSSAKRMATATAA